MYKVKVLDQVIEVEEGTTYEQLAERFQEEYDHQIALVFSDGKIKELFKKINKDCTVEFITLEDSIGHKSYGRSAIMMFIKAARDVLGEKLEDLKVEFALGPGFYISARGKFEIDQKLVDAIEKRMREMVEQKLPIWKKSYPLTESVAIMHQEKMEDKARLFRYRRSSSVNLYCLDGYYDYYYGYMLPNTSYIKYFQLISYDEGFLLVLPTRQNPKKIEFVEPREKLFHTMVETSKWAHHIGIEDVGELNDRICESGLRDVILLQEAEQERRIGEIARQIKERSHVKFVLIAGPSSSGKTSFANRLCIQLRSLGKIPHLISLDDYFKNREDTPRDEKGDYDFECLEAIDTDTFNRDMSDLLNGKRVEIPHFNFTVGKREYNGNYQQLGPDDVLAMEGIHGLNPRMTEKLPNDSKFKIYISALTSLNVDDHNYISTTDSRLLRRMVRDARTRGASAKRTIQMWPSVRRGEERNIFPYQEEADVMFNSVLIYELAVLKQYAEPLLFSIREDEPEFYEAKRLLKFLNYFLGMDTTSLPNNSICREFVGGSCFKV
ncbi:MAG: nucleoside kinase [Lachnospiraceae bacterium]|nr:nucleoside kinase [Lachnospiraceae bacterium]